MTASLKRSMDRKVTNSVSPNGKTPNIANTFGLPSGTAFSCPSATTVCEKVCYAGKLEKIYKGVRDVLLHNWNLLRDADEDTMVILIQNMIIEFEKDCEKRGAEKLFRCHWDGDFFSPEYANAWRRVMLATPSVHFWVYTRSPFAVPILKGIDNLALYFSTDDANMETAKALRTDHGVSLAYLAQNFAMGKETMKPIVGKAGGASCPENAKKIPLISQKGSACVTCSLCVFEKSDIVFSVSKK